MTKVTRILALLSALALGACGAEQARATDAQRADQAPTATVTREAPPSPLAAAVPSRDLGTVEITGGLIRTEFAVTNAGDTPTGLTAAYTSCMCTEVTLQFEDGTRRGPFGMPGHDLPVTLERPLAPGESFTVLAAFDPMAHGPEAVGPVRRGIALHTENGGMLRLDFAVNVVKEATPPAPGTS